MKSQATLPPHSTGRLCVVATPIGNLGDITLRALETLKSADLIACEDTRTSATLLAHYGITTRTVSYHAHNEAMMSEKLLQQLQQGATIALISDAGTPLVSDPGARLVAAARAADIPVTPLPGASALLAALTMAGIPAQPFYFGGFLPPKTQACAQLLASLKTLQATLVFYEAPHRMIETLQTLQQHLGDRQAAVAREITKHFESCPRGSLSTLITHFTAHAPRGECVVLVEGASEAERMSEDAIDAALRAALTRLSVKEAVAEITAISGQPRRVIYQRALALTGA